MKKTLAAVAILGAFAGSAMADVTVYGRINTGLNFTDKAISSVNGVTGAYQEDFYTKKAFDMTNGEWTGSRLGFKGTEDLGNGLKAGFVLEAGVRGDTGTGDMFRREAIVSVSGDFGTVAFGRMGTLAGSAGSFATFAPIASVMGTGTLGAVGTGYFAKSDSRLDNAVAYRSPEFAGFQVSAQVGTVGDTAYDDETGNRDAAVALTYKAGALKAAAIVEEYDRGAVEQQMYGLAATYDFGVAKVSFGSQFFKNAADVAGMVADLNTISAANKWVVAGSITNAHEKANYNKFKVDESEGYALTLGAEGKAFGGVLSGSVSYVEGNGTLVMQKYSSADGKYVSAKADKEVDAKAWNVGVNYAYDFSKQFMVYVGAAYSAYECEDAKGVKFAEMDAYSAYTGLVYKF